MKSCQVVYDLKLEGTLEFKLVAPMLEQIRTTTIHFVLDSIAQQVDNVYVGCQGGENHLDQRPWTGLSKRFNNLDPEWG